MLVLNMDYLNELEEHLKSGRIECAFTEGSQSKRFEILEFLEKLMDVAELADETATKLIFKGSYLEMASGVKLQK